MPASRYPIGVSQYGHARVRAGLDEEDDDQEDPDDDDDDSLSQSCPQDRIRRNYLGQRPGANLASSQAEASLGASARPETIEVQLNEGFLSRERRFLYDILANTRSKLSTMQMFNPARNQSMREQQESWDEKVSSSGQRAISAGYVGVHATASQPESGRLPGEIRATFIDCTFILIAPAAGSAGRLARCAPDSRAAAPVGSTSCTSSSCTPSVASTAALCPTRLTRPECHSSRAARLD